MYKEYKINQLKMLNKTSKIFKKLFEHKINPVKIF